jgi:hypothetical protein
MIRTGYRISSPRLGLGLGLGLQRSKIIINKKFFSSHTGESVRQLLYPSKAGPSTSPSLSSISPPVPPVPQVISTRYIERAFYLVRNIAMKSVEIVVLITLSLLVVAEFSVAYLIEKEPKIAEIATDPEVRVSYFSFYLFLSLSLFLSLCVFVFHSHTLTLSVFVSLSLSHTHTLSLSHTLSLTHSLSLTFSL